jgi:osmotically-inducible protein OsmY
MKFSTQRLVIVLTLAAGIGAGLAACAPVVIGGAMMGSLMATDRRTSGTQIEDEGIELRAAGRIRENVGERVHINVTSYNRQVLLTGEAPSAQDRQMVETVVATVENVRSIVNEIGIQPISSLSQRSSDVLIAGRAKAAFVDAKDLFANAFKVVAERGTVYLMGRVTQREASRATDIVRDIDNVQKVVRLFEIISEQELQNLLPKPAANEVKK